MIVRLAFKRVQDGSAVGSGHKLGVMIMDYTRVIVLINSVVVDPMCMLNPTNSSRTAESHEVKNHHN